MFMISYLILMLFVLISVAYLTLLERSVLGYIQIRSGPNSVGYMGLLQPFADGIKLFFSEQIFLYKSNWLIYYLIPVFMLILSFTCWLVYPYLIGVYDFELGILFFLCCSGIGVYGVLFSGWSSNSSYSLLGAIRAVAQTISYEVSMALIMVCLIIFIYSFRIIDFMWYQKYVWFIFFSLPLFLMWFSSCLAETNRSPFDFAEGESELVSGFNVEYSSGGFAFIFLSEYMNIIFMSFITAVIFMGCSLASFYFYILLVCLMFMFIWIRGTLPRLRYDSLMYLTWSGFLPASLNYLLFLSGFLVYILKVA